MPKYDVFKPNPLSYLVNDWDRTYVHQLPEDVNGFNLAEFVQEQIENALPLDEDYEANLTKAIDSRLIDLEDLINVGGIVDMWVEAETFDPERVTTKEAAWAIVSDRGQAIITANLADNEFMPNGKSWNFEVFRWDENHEEWIPDDLFKFMTPDALGNPYRYIKSVADANRCLDGTYDGIADINVKSALHIQFDGSAIDYEVVRIAPEFAHEEYIDVNKKIRIEYSNDDKSLIEFDDLALDRGINWESRDKPVFPPLEKFLDNIEELDKSYALFAKAGDYDVSIIYSDILNPDTNSLDENAALTVQVSEKLQLDGMAPKLIYCAQSDAYCDVRSAIVELLDDAYSHVGSYFNGIDTGHETVTTSFDHALMVYDSLKQNGLSGRVAYPHPSEFKEAGPSYAATMSDGTRIELTQHDDCWAFYAGNIGDNSGRAASCYGETFAEAYGKGFEQMSCQAELADAPAVVINNPIDDTNPFRKLAEVGNISVMGPDGERPKGLDMSVRAVSIRSGASLVENAQISARAQEARMGLANPPGHSGVR